MTVIVGPYVADFNETHIYNPKWTPHAKFHTGQTMSMGLYLGLSTLYFLWKPISNSASKEVQRSLEKERLGMAMVLAAMYWVTQLAAILYPGTLGYDPEFGEGFPQLWISGGHLTIGGLGYLLESRRIEKLGGKKD